MKVVLDTNVFVSGVFFGGQPHKILARRKYSAFALASNPGRVSKGHAWAGCSIPSTEGTLRLAMSQIEIMES